MTDDHNPCNVRYQIDDDDVMTITIDLKRRLRPSEAMRKDPTKGNMLIATTPRHFPLVNSDGTVRRESLTIHCFIKEPLPITETERLLDHAMNVDIDPKIKEVLALVRDSTKGFPKMFRAWLEGKLHAAD